jgi:hypothetical protein
MIAHAMTSLNLLEGTVTLTELDEAWKTPGHGRRLHELRKAADRVRDRIVAGPRVVSVRTFHLTELPYPVRYAFNGVAFPPAPFVIMTHRAVLVQFLQFGALKNLLFNPTDIESSRATPFFSRLASKLPKVLEPLLAHRYAPIDDQLAELGVRADDIDYIAFDHFHTQDLRSALGSADGATASHFPNAILLAPQNEWDEWDYLHPMQRDWFVRDGKSGVNRTRVALTHRDLALGDGVFLLRTPGHTIGSQTLFFHTSEGVWGVSENGTCADSWSPLDSKIAGLASHCRKSGIDVVLNANTPEVAVDQYASMVIERTIVDRVRRAPAFVQMFSSSEITPSLIAPGLAPTLLHRAIGSGDIARPTRTVTPLE